MLDRDEYFDAGSPRLDTSPVDYGLTLARREQAEWLILLRGSQIRLYSAQPGVGVGSRGLTETFFELDLTLLEEDQAGYLDLAFSAPALIQDGTVTQLLEGSRDYAVGLGDRLRERIYEEAIPELAVAVAKELERLDHQAGKDLAHAYRITLRILFRLLFQAYAEDCGLLPYGTNEEYGKYSLKRHARKMADPPQEMFDSRSHKIWDELLLVWGVIDTGDAVMEVPAYNGGLFLSEPDRSPDGALISQMRLNNAVVGHALRRLLVDVDSNDLPGPVDFRSLSIREFGTIYEGLLASSLSRADQDLTLDKKQTYVPAKPGGKAEVRAGEIYFHNKSGMRKSAGVYFTPRFAVDHLLERSLVPVLRDHLKKISAMLDEGDEVGAYESFFDFRVCDPAMGSGNFLVAAIDHAASEISPFLAAHPIQGVTGELNRLETTARKALGDAADQYPLDRSMLLRRQIARHCIYGIDNNDIAVELAKVAVWLHTFVPGLPMSTLDHNLVCADSLTGIESVEEAIEILDPQRKQGVVSLMRGPLEESLEESRRHLREAVNISEATTAEVRQADESRGRAVQVARKAKAIFDAAVAARIGELGNLTMVEPDEIVRMAEQPDIQERMRILNPGHMPYLFPEVFLRDNPGFDVMVGNPPWEKIKVEEHAWWGLRFPGLRGLDLMAKQVRLKSLKRERPDLVDEYEQAIILTTELRKILSKGIYPGMGTGDPDLFKAFSWRFWNLTRDGGAVGIVLPSGALKGKGSERWRKQVFEECIFVDLVPLINTGGWVFDDIHKQSIVGLMVLGKGSGKFASIRINNLCRSESDLQRIDASNVVQIDEFLSWTPEALFPLFPSVDAIRVFRKMINHPRIRDASVSERQRASASVSERQRASGTALPYYHKLEDKAGNRITYKKRQRVFPRSRTSWRALPIRELETTPDRHRFTAMSDNLWPVYGGRSFNLWRPDTGEYYAATNPDTIIEYLQGKRERSRSSFADMPQEWLDDLDTLPCKHPRIAFHDVTNSVDSRTIIAALVPPNIVITEKTPYLIWPSGEVSDQAFLLGVLSSMILDWYARRIVSTHCKFYIFNSLPVPDADPEDPVTRRVVEISGRLAAVDERFAEWAAEVGVPVGMLREEPGRSEAIAELDACVALLYGLDEDDLQIIYETFHETNDYSEHHAKVLAHFRRWREAGESP